VQKSKEKTSRVALWRELMIPNVFTMEASFCGSEKLGCHFTCEQYMEVGKELCRSIIYYFDLMPKNIPLSIPPSTTTNTKAVIKNEVQARVQAPPNGKGL